MNAAFPTVPEVRPLVRALHARHSAGCCLHVVLDDGNIDDRSVRFCLDNAKHVDCKELASILMDMSRTQRKKLLLPRSVCR